jgi:hypothetical protein
MMEKLRWLEEAHQVVQRLQRQRADRASQASRPDVGPKTSK